MCKLNQSSRFVAGKKVWTQEEKDYLKTNCRTMKVGALAKALGRTQYATKDMIWTLVHLGQIQPAEINPRIRQCIDCKVIKRIKAHGMCLNCWQRKNKDRFDGYHRKAYLKLRGDVLTHYSKDGTPKCVCCGVTEIEFLTLDHVNNDGARHRLLLHGNIYRKLRLASYPSEPPLQILCQNCNSAKRFARVCPHQRILGMNPFVSI